MSNTGGTILKLLLKQQNTKPVSGRPAALRVGVAAAISRLLSLPSSSQADERSSPCKRHFDRMAGQWHHQSRNR